MLKIALVASVLLSACAVDPSESDDLCADDLCDTGDGKEDGAANPLIGAWRADETPRNGEVQTMSIYKRGTFRKKLAYDVSTQTITEENITNQIDWGFLQLAEGLLAFDSRARDEALVPVQEVFVTGSGDERELSLTRYDETFTFHLDLAQKCGGGLPRCLDHYDCNAGWCVADRPF